MTATGPDVDAGAGVPLADGVARFRYALYARTPRVWATKLLVAMNVAVFVAMVAGGVSPMSPTIDSLIKWGADYAPRTTAGEWWRLLSNTFVHVGVVHIAMNMIGLWQIGGLVERLLGHRSFLLVYVFSGLCGSLASLTWHPYVVSAGASGAVFGVYGVLVAYLVRHRGSIPRPVLLQLQKSTLFFIGLNVVFGLQQKGIDMAAHIGGFFGGFVAALLVARPLQPGPLPRTIVRDLMLVGVGLVLFAAAVVLLPRPADLQSELASFARVENGVVDTYNRALAARREERLSDSALAQLIDEQVLPPWRQVRQHLDTLQRLPPGAAGQLDRIRRYMTLREQGWTALSQALRTDDDAKARASKNFQQEADALQKESPETTR